MKKKSVTICFLGNPYFDTRVNNLGNSLENAGYEVNIIGFDWRNPEFIPEYGKTTIYKIHKGKFSLFFYLHYAFLLKWKLLRSKSEIFFAEDIYTLPFVYFFAKLKRAKVIYNSRELFGYLAGLRNKKFVQRLIAKIESIFITKVDLVLTTGEMDTEFIKKQYNIENVITIRNLPLLKTAENKIDYRKMFNLDEKVKILFYQGVLFEGRGLEIIIKSLQELPDCVFVLCGSGEQKQKFIDCAEKYKVSKQVIFLGVINQNELINYTAGADLGLSLIENLSVSYYHALPNKLFEYVMASVPALVSDLPQMKNIVEKYQVGKVVDIENGKLPVNAIREILENKTILSELKLNCQKARLELNWEKEFEILEKYLNEF